MKLLMYLFTLSALMIMNDTCTMDQQSLDQAQNFAFERKEMSKGQWGGYIEGYWAASPDPARDHYEGKFPWPVANEKPWPQQEEFSKKLASIEEFLKSIPMEEFLETESNGVIAYKGCTQSRIEYGLELGNGEYRYTDHETGKTISWPQDLRTHYIDKHNVEISEDFFNLIVAAAAQLGKQQK